LKSGVFFYASGWLIQLLIDSFVMGDTSSKEVGSTVVLPAKSYDELSKHVAEVNDMCVSFFFDCYLTQIRVREHVCSRGEFSIEFSIRPERKDDLPPFESFWKAFVRVIITTEKVLVLSAFFLETKQMFASLITHF
jgi:hypothetical protein